MFKIMKDKNLKYREGKPLEPQNINSYSDLTKNEKKQTQMQENC